MIKRRSVVKTDIAGESSHAPDCSASALVEALRDTHRHIEELERIQVESRSSLMTHEAKIRALMLTKQIIALSSNLPPCVNSDASGQPRLAKEVNHEE
jgi:hypothetical protein